MDINDINKNKACAFTGHRIISDEEIIPLQNSLEAAVLELALSGTEYFLCGGALGFDTMAAVTVLRIRNAIKKVKLVLLLPCKNQTTNWKSTDKEIYEKIKEFADGVFYLSEGYNRGCMLKRNRALIDNSSKLICYVKRNYGGSAYTKKYAKENGVEIVELHT